jgi:hypothetical protein
MSLRQAPRKRGASGRRQDSRGSRWATTEPLAAVHSPCAVDSVVVHRRARDVKQGENPLERKKYLTDDLRA